VRGAYPPMASCEVRNDSSRPNRSSFWGDRFLRRRKVKPGPQWNPLVGLAPSLGDPLNGRCWTIAVSVELAPNGPRDGPVRRGRDVRNRRKCGGFVTVGATGFEPATFRPPAEKWSVQVRPVASPPSPAFPAFPSGGSPKWTMQSVLLRYDERWASLSGEIVRADDSPPGSPRLTALKSLSCGPDPSSGGRLRVAASRIPGRGKPPLGHSPDHLTLGERPPDHALPAHGRARRHGEGRCLIE
jgi:hypothetical protein